MKKSIIALVAITVFILSVSTQFVMAQETLSYRLSAETVNLSDGDGYFVITVPTPADGCTGVQIYLKTAVDVELKTSFDPSGIVGQRDDPVAGGRLYYSVMGIASNENRINRDIKCTVIITYNGSQERSVEIEQIRLIMSTSDDMETQVLTGASVIRVVPGSRSANPPHYYVNTNASIGGKVEGNNVTYNEGEPAALTAVPDDGYEFTGWFEYGNQVETSLTYSFNVTSHRDIEARFELTGENKPRFKILVGVGSEGGGTAAGGGEYYHGQTVKIAATPNTGWEFSGWYENDALIPNWTRTQEFPAAKERNLEARFVDKALVPVQENSVTGNRYIDVSDPNEWFYNAVYFVTDNRLMFGTEANLFSPRDPVTRAMFVTILGRMADNMLKTTTGFSNPFEDVYAGEYFTQYIAWAADNGIVAGYDETTFGPYDHVTREQMAALMVRFCEYLKVELDDSKIISFADAGDVSAWARESVRKAAAAGLMQGSNGRFYPRDTAMRAEIAQLFKNFVESYL